MIEAAPRTLLESTRREREDAPEGAQVSVLDASKVEQAMRKKGEYVLPERTAGSVRIEADTEVIFLGVMDLSSLEVALASPKQHEVPEGSTSVDFVPSSPKRQHAVKAWRLAGTSEFIDGDAVIDGFDAIRRANIQAARDFVRNQGLGSHVAPERARKIVITTGVTRYVER